MIILILILIVFTGYWLYYRSGFGLVSPKENLNFKNIAMEILSPSFKNNESIPAKYTCDGANTNPSLLINRVPSRAQSLALIINDPDAPRGTWTHWLVWNIDPRTTEIKENSVSTGAIQGTTSFGRIGYGGPCPPSGTHRYFFKLFALDTKLELSSNSKAEDLERAMTGHVLDQSELIGLYRRR